jgi:hypothetical protein
MTQSTIHVLPAEELSRILAEFQKRYGVQFSRDTFTQEQPSADCTFVLSPDNDDPLPQIGCQVKVRGYKGEVWQTVVVDVNEDAGMYTAEILYDQEAVDLKRSRFGDDHMAAMYDGGRLFEGESAV